MGQQKTIALLSQPNAGKSTLFNGLTGSRQHVGNWPGKTVEKKEGHFSHGGNDYTIIDLPGTYSLSANSNEEIVTRDYIASGKADLVCIMADASQLERSLYMLADFAGITTPVMVILNMMDVATEQGKQIDCAMIAKRLQVPVVGMSAAELKNYDSFYKGLEKALAHPKSLHTIGIDALYREMAGDCYIRLMELLPAEGIEAYSSMWLAVKLMEGDAVIQEKVEKAVKQSEWKTIKGVLSTMEKGNLLTGNCKFQWIDELLKNAITLPKKEREIQSRFDRLATSRHFGKPLAIGIILLGLVVSLVIAFLSSALGKEASLGVLAALFDLGASSGTSGVWGAMFAGGATDSALLGGTLLSTISKPEALAYIFAFFFNVPCIAAMGGAFEEIHSWKWTVRIILYYIAVALLMSTIAYHVGLLIF